MKKVILLTAFTLVVSVGVVFAQSRAMAVMPFDVVGNVVTADEVEALTELYTSTLIETGRVRIVDRVNFDKVMKELNFQSSDWSNSEKTVKIGQALNADFISRGKIMKLGSKLSISVSVIYLKTSENVASTSGRYDDIDHLVYYFFCKKSSDSYRANAAGKIDDMLKIVADFYSGKGQAGGSIFYNDGNNSYEAIFLENEGPVKFKKALDIASGSYAGYNDWHLPTEDKVKYILCNIKDAKDKSFWVYNTYRGETFQSSTLRNGKPVEMSCEYRAVINGCIMWSASIYLVCLVRKCPNE